jgi:hypothetical protein
VCVDVEPFEVKMITTTEYQLGPDLAQVELGHDGAATTPPQLAHGRTPSLLPASPPHVMHVTPMFGDINLDNDHDEDAPLRFQRMDNVLGHAEVPGLVQRMLQEELHAVSTEEMATI